MINDAALYVCNTTLVLIYTIYISCGMFASGFGGLHSSHYLILSLENHKSSSATFPERESKRLSISQTVK